MSAPHRPISVEPRRIRPPYDQRDDQFDAVHRAYGTDPWIRALRADRVLALREPLESLVVTDYEARQLEWLAGWDVGVVAVFAGLLHRAREARPLPVPRLDEEEGR